MRLKRREAIQWSELPKIESPFFAVTWVRNNANINGTGLNGMIGMDDVMTSDLEPDRHVWDVHAHDRLLEKVERAEIFLVHGLGSDPVLPIVRRGEKEDDNWLVDDSLGLVVRFNVEWMLGYASRTRGIWAPILVPKARPRDAVQPKAAPEQDKPTLESSFALEQLVEVAKNSTKAEFVALVVPVFGYDIPAKTYIKLYDELRAGKIKSPEIEIVWGGIS
jgi:hypothetical protein